MALITCPECSKDIAETANTCPDCGYDMYTHRVNKEFEEVTKPALFRCLLWSLPLIMLFFLYTYMDPNASPSAAPRSSQTPLSGDTATLRTTGDADILVANSRRSYDRLLELLRANDRVGATQMMLAGTIWPVSNGTTCRIISSGSVYEVRIKDGPYSGQAGFVGRSFVSKR